MIDEKLRALEKGLVKELEEIKALLNTVLEGKKEVPKLAKLYDDYHESKGDTLSPRQSEIDNFNNTIQRTSLLNGLYHYVVTLLRGLTETWELIKSFEL